MPTDLSIADWLQIERAGSSAPVQACVIDHSGPGYAEPHLHVMLHFASQQQTPWVVFNSVRLMDLSQALGSVRIHLHEEAPKEAVAVADRAVVASLPRHVITADEAALMQADGAGNCVICMEEYRAGDEVACMPCAGLHKAHFACLNGWLERAATCPSCRYALPSKELSKGETELLMQPASREMGRVQRAEPAPCQLAESEEGSAEAETARSAGSAVIGNTREGMAWAAPSARTTAPPAVHRREAPMMVQSLARLSASRAAQPLADELSRRADGTRKRASLQRLSTRLHLPTLHTPWGRRSRASSSVSM